MTYIKFQNLSSVENSIPIKQSFPDPMLSPTPNNHQSGLCLCGFTYSSYFV